MKFAMMDSRLLDLLQTSEHLPYIIAGFFFHDRGIMVQKSISGMLQELLHSVLLKSSALRQFVDPTYTALVEAQKTRLPTWDVESLQLAFEAIIKQRQVVTRLFLFLDALDEHHGDNEHLANLMKKLVALADGTVVKVKLCLASRPWDTFVTSFGKCPGFKIHDHTYNDIRAYTLAEFTQSSSTEFEVTLTKDARSTKLEALAVQVTEKAHGVFIWVRIVVEEIAKGLRARIPFFVLEEKLANIPEELKDLYRHTLERIEPEHAEESYVMLQIAICALSPLALDAFVNSTSHAVWRKVPEVGEESVEDMTQRVVSRSGGLLEVIESTLVETSTALASGRCDTVALGKQVATDFDAPPEDASKEDSKPRYVYVTHRVQFIHQTVKEYVQSRKDNFGLKRNRTGGTGFHYILATAVRYERQWADEIGLDLFEYARLANVYKTVELREELWFSLDTLGGSFRDDTRVDWWMWQKEIKFYEIIFRRCVPSLKVACLAFAAGLFDYVERSLDEYSKRYLDFFFSAATIGPSITSVQIPRRDMLSFLVRHGYSVDHDMDGLFSLKIPSAVTPLALIIQTKGQFDQDEKERVSAIAWLLDHGANPNPERHTVLYNELLFSYCIRQESVEVVRLFGQYGATLPREMIVPLRTLWQMLSTPSEVLEEVIRIMQRNYPDVDFDEKKTITIYHDGTDWPHPISEIFWDTDTATASPVLGAVAAMSFGISRVFAAEYSTLASLRRGLAGGDRQRARQRELHRIVWDQ
jgi:hypothetical protein